MYRVISYSVVQWTQEIGIRTTLAVTPGPAQFDVIWQMICLVVAGVAIGFAAALEVSHLIASMLFETAPTDTVAFIGTLFLLTCAALAAAVLPAYRAAHVDPMRVIRPM